MANVDFIFYKASIHKDRMTKEKQMLNPNCLNIFRLMEEAKERLIQQCGSSSVDPTLKPTCERITKLMAENFSIFIYPQGNTEQSKGDLFGRLYIGGYKRLSDKEEITQVTAAQYLETFLSNLEGLGLDKKTIREFDELCLDFLTTLQSPSRVVGMEEIRDL